ncbi:hypothetical protein DAPPUDRAFT_304303 [Daphnia pulex]|uniref:DNA replication complex GINS protein SLD5 n=1 Tax=Daphnia pulex TaxID=6669 RepID=E9GL26_DAPPU|nr:DNA replication complex GINS protein SLD5-like [Daphnia pulicaria]EFX79780.1 hypothetical protein DAPPUDRAFT_304303 [Daphnia pulex]|eukprot:EFX79780.1 hypothetical protein DAPPUDRAFT_304303 [Daphnia pulex]
MASYSGNLTQLSDLFGTADTISETEDAEFLSASEAVKKLEESWLNEMLAPELLSPQTELVDCLLEQTKNMEENLMAISKSDFRFALHRMEVERIRYVVTSYLRIRLEKIEKFLGYLLNNENKRQRNEPSLLTEDELKFAQELNSNTETHLKTLGLRHMPTNMREINTQKFITTPNRDSYVFVCVKDDAPSVLVSDGTSEGEIEVELLKNSQHLLPYRSISSLLQNNTVNLL